jgi:hypothetical protein
MFLGLRKTNVISFNARVTSEPRVGFVLQIFWGNRHGIAKLLLSVCLEKYSSADKQRARHLTRRIEL